MRLTPGTAAPALQATSHLGEPVDLAELRGRPVLLSFYRYASCPVCNLRVRAIIRALPGLPASGLGIIAVFQSPPATVAKYVGRQDAPFPIVSDPALRHYRAFGVETRWGGLFSRRALAAVVRALRRGFSPGRIDGPVQRVPADFLIAPDGRIAVAHYGKDIDDHLPLETVEAWLHRIQPAPTLP